MSELLYDSLEDEGDERPSSGSEVLARRREAVSVGEPPRDGTPFYLGTERSAQTFVKNGSREGSFLPKIEDSSKRKGAESGLNVVVNNEVLSKQGLQMNNDGSFTKSPRADEERLPFIAREYKNLQFQKRKTYQTKKKPFNKVQRKNIFTFTENPGEGVSMVGLIGARRKKGTSEEILTSGGSVSSRNGSSRGEREFVVDDNLTDSMKEMLLRKQQENKLRAQNRGFGRARQPRRVPKVVSEGKAGRGTKPPLADDKVTQTTGGFLLGGVDGGDALGKTCRRKVFKYQSDIAVISAKPRLSYSERRQMEIGFRPMSLRREKKVASDTERSNFGDSVADELSEVSSRVMSQEDVAGEEEEEEAFYRRLMQRERNGRGRGRGHASARSVPLDDQSKSLVDSLFSKDQKEGTESMKNNSTAKRFPKATSIDLPAVVDKSSGQASRKFSHYCSANSSPTMSKTELALKARAYGHMANARNIFRLKTQSDGKLTPSGGENCLLLKKNNSSTRPERVGESVESLGGHPRASRSLCTAGRRDAAPEDQNGFVLPQVARPEPRDWNFRSQAPGQIGPAFDGSASQTELPFRRGTRGAASESYHQRTPSGTPS